MPPAAITPSGSRCVRSARRPSTAIAAMTKHIGSTTNCTRAKVASAASTRNAICVRRCGLATAQTPTSTDASTSGYATGSATTSPA
jgi:hypothetical protein